MAADAPQLFLIDGNSLAYRAFFALPESIGTSDGRPTNAIYGLASMLVKIIDEHHPQGVVVAWDAGMSGREVTYDLYKAQRKPRPDLLREQWPHLMPLVEAFGYTNVKVEGFEADDVIASLTRQAREQGIEVMVVTGDRDAYQLVGEGVRVMSTSRGITETKIYDSDAVLERYGVPPELVTDLMGLRGDTSDNIPGVPGIGEKTASQLLQQFGSLEKVLESVDEISGAKRKQNLIDHADDARMSKELATLQYEIETGVDLAAAMESEPDRGALREFMREFELRAVLERLEEALPEGEAVPGRSVETELAIEVESRGRPADLGEGPVALAIDGDRWAAAEGERILAGSCVPRRAGGGAGRQAARRPRRQVARRRPPRPARRRGPRGRRARPRPRHDDRRLPAGAPAPHLRADRAGRRRRDRPRRGRRRGQADEDDGQLALGEEVEAGLDPAEEARLVAALAEVQRPRIEELGPGAAAARGRAAAGPRAGGDGTRGAEARRRAPGRGRRRLRRADRDPGEGDLRAGRGGVHDRLAAAGRPHPLREARAEPQAPRQNRLLDRRPRPRPDPRRAPDRREDRVLARADQAQEHLPRLAAGPDRPRRPAASTPPSTRPRRPPAASPAPTRTCRTSRSGPRSAVRSAPASSPSRAPSCSPPTTARSSCGCSPTSPTRRC